LADLAEKYIDCPIAGRTHVQHAVPITFGLKIAVWLMEIRRHLDRMEDCKKRLFAASFYGASGNLASLGQDGLKVTEKMAHYLDLDFVPVPWHTSRDNLAEFISVLTGISSTFGKIASELYELSRTEVGEVEEPWTYGNVGSSTMPQKRNAFGLEAMVGLSKITQFEQGAIYAGMMHEHERDFRAANIEGFTIFMTCSMTEKNLHYAQLILERLTVHPDKMLSNLDMTGGLIMSESIMMHLGEKMGRLTAHEKIYEMAMDAFTNGKHLKDLVLADQDIMALCTPEEIEACFAPIAYVGDAHRMVLEALKASR
ncbi:MAG: lyase family protein, partial [Oscillospiraceae bacterium]